MFSAPHAHTRLYCTQVRALAICPTVLEIDVPITATASAISYYGDRSGELANYLQQLAPPSSPTQEQHEEQEEDGESHVVKVATLACQLPTMAARDVLATVLRMRLAGASQGPWEETEAMRAGVAAKAAAQAAAARQQLQEERDRGESRVPNDHPTE